MRIETTVMTSRGQIVIPERVRQDFGLTVGTQFVVFIAGDTIVLKPLTPEMFPDVTAIMNALKQVELIK